MFGGLPPYKGLLSARVTGRKHLTMISCQQMYVHTYRYVAYKYNSLLASNLVLVLFFVSGTGKVFCYTKHNANGRSQSGQSVSGRTIQGKLQSAHLFARLGLPRVHRLRFGSLVICPNTFLILCWQARALQHVRLPLLKYCKVFSAIFQVHPDMFTGNPKRGCKKRLIQ